MKNKEQEHRRINNHTIRKNNNYNEDQIAIKPQRTISKTHENIQMKNKEHKQIALNTNTNKWKI
jgi:hypothetical protein